MPTPKVILRPALNNQLLQTTATETRITTCYPVLLQAPQRKDFAAKAKAWYYAEHLKDKHKCQNINQKCWLKKIGRNANTSHLSKRGGLICNASHFYVSPTHLAYDFRQCCDSQQSFRNAPHTCRCSCGIPHSHPQHPASTLGRNGPYNSRRGLYCCKSPLLLYFARYVFVIPLGFEPKTHSLEGCCSNPTELRNQSKSGAKVYIFFDIAIFQTPKYKYFLL